MKSPPLLRHVPSVAELLESPHLKGLLERVNRNVVVSGVRTFLDDLRTELQRATADLRIPSVSELAERIAGRILAGDSPALRPVINATGILLHDALGRAPLADEAIHELVSAARDYVSLDLDLASGGRVRRETEAAAMLCQRTGAEAAWVAGNHAGATLLALTSLAAGRELVVARSQLADLGDDYRLPETIAASGATLREVGATNRTRIEDYAAAITPQTAAILRVAAGNYRIVGLAGEASLEELVALGRRRGVPVIDNLGAGTLIDLAPFGCEGVPVVADSIAAGADLVLVSGDKLVGGPQCGIIVGQRTLVERLAAHPLARALRVDKLTLAALTATLWLYRDPEQARDRIPLLQLLSTSIDNLKNRAERLAPQLAACGAIESAESIATTACLTEGSLATSIPTWCVALVPKEGKAHELAKLLRRGVPPVVARIDEDRLLLDLRTVFPRQDAQLVAAVEKLCPAVAAATEA